MYLSNFGAGAPMQVRLLRRAEFIELQVTGTLLLQPLLEMVTELGQLTHDEGDSRVLLDLLHAGGDVHLFGQMRVGEQVVLKLAHLVRIASLQPTARITRMSERVARSQGVQLRVFDARDDAVAWLCDAVTQPDELLPEPGSALMDGSQAAIWAAVRHLVPSHAQAIQLPNGALAISWAIANQPGAVYEMATPITIRLEPDLLERLRDASADRRQSIAEQQEPSFRAGLMGYDPLTAVPKARVIVLG